MNDVELREKLMSHCPNRYLDTICETLRVTGQVGDYEMGRLLWEDLVSDAEQLVAIQQKQENHLEPEGEQGDGRGDEQEAVTPRLNDTERERAAAFEEHLSYVASADSRVLRYRSKVLPGGLLTPERARTFVNSPAAQFFSQGLFERSGVPFVDHSAELVGKEGNRVRRRFTIRVEPPGISETVMVQRLRVLPFIGESGRVERVAVGERSVLGELADLADRLAKVYPWASKAEIVGFVLTGAVPSVPPVRAWRSQKSRGGHFFYDTITVEAASWVRPETIQAAFREARRQMWGSRRKNQPIGEKSLRVFRFVTERSDPIGRLKEGEPPKAGDMAPGELEGWTTDELIVDMRYEKRPKGRELVEEWNNTAWVREKRKERRYDPDDHRLFLRDYHRVRRALAYAPRQKS